MNSGWRGALTVVIGACLASCTAHRQAGTGDLAFRLTWSGISDLDLLVEDPSGTCIFFGNREAASGGVLDVDCNAGPDPCPRPIENIFWPTSAAPPGTYRSWVHAHALVPAEAPLRFELQLLRGKVPIFRHQGTLRDHEEARGPFVLDFPRGRVVRPSAPATLPPSCASRTFFSPPSRSSPREDPDPRDTSEGLVPAACSARLSREGA